MVKSFSYKITSFLICNKTIKDEEYDLYLYGFEILIAFIVNIITILLMGCALNRFYETIAFLICYCPIRQFAGGYHADNYKRCLLVFTLVYLTNMFILEKLMYNSYDCTILIGAIISALGICFMAPLEHRNNPLSNSDKVKYKHITMIIVIIIFILSIIGFNFKLTYRLSTYTLSSISCTFIMLILGAIKKWRGKKMGKKFSCILKNMCSLVLGVVFLSANTTSTWISHQPKMPDEVSKFKIKK